MTEPEKFKDRTDWTTAEWAEFKRSGERALNPEWVQWAQPDWSDDSDEDPPPLSAQEHLERLQRNRGI